MTASNPGESDQEMERRIEEPMRELRQPEEKYRTLFYRTQTSRRGAMD